MSRFLKSKKTVLCLFMLLALIFCVFKLWYLALLCLIGIILFLLNLEILSRCNRPRWLLSAQREVSLYRTFIIGDMCPTNLARGKDTLVMTAVGRSLEASYQILLHTISGLSEGNLRDNV